MILKDVEVFWMTEQEIALFGKAFLMGRKCEQINKACGGEHIINIGYDTKGDYFFLKDWGQEVKTFPNPDKVLEFLEEALVRLKSRGDLLG
jgi:hypothetical protein